MATLCVHGVIPEERHELGLAVLLDTEVDYNLLYVRLHTIISLPKPSSYLKSGTNLDSLFSLMKSNENAPPATAVTDTQPLPAHHRPMQEVQSAPQQTESGFGR